MESVESQRQPSHSFHTEKALDAREEPLLAG